MIVNMFAHLAWDYRTLSSWMNNVWNSCPLWLVPSPLSQRGTNKVFFKVFTNIHIRKFSINRFCSVFVQLWYHSCAESIEGALWIAKILMEIRSDAGIASSRDWSQIFFCEAKPYSRMSIMSFGLLLNPLSKYLIFIFIFVENGEISTVFFA